MSNSVRLASGLQMDYELLGSGTPLICIPGWGFSTHVFAKNLPALAEHYQVIAINPRSHGTSQVTLDNNNYAQQGEDLKDFIEALELKKCVLLGWSLGVYALYAYLDSYGTENTHAVIAVDESPRIIKYREDDWGEGTEEEINGLIETVASGGYLEFFREYTAEGFVMAPEDTLLKSFTETASCLTPEVAAGLLRDASERDYSDLAISVVENIPVLNILREAWANEATDWIKKNQPKAEIKVLGGHLMLYEFAREFNSYVLDFLKRVLK